jgi:hypothetical protein
MAFINANCVKFSMIFSWLNFRTWLFCIISSETAYSCQTNISCEGTYHT